MTTDFNPTVSGVSEDILVRVQKLLALSHSSNPNEAASAMAMASKLLQQYNLDLAEVVGFGQAVPIEEVAAGGAELVDRKKKLQFNFQTNGKWIKRIASALAKANMCEIHTDNYQKVVFVGPKHQLPVVTYMFYSVFNQVVEMMRKAGSEYSMTYKASYGVSPTHVSGSEHISVFVRSWLEGAEAEIIKRLEEQAAEFNTERRQIKGGAKVGQVITGQELVVVNRTAIEEYYRKTRPHWYAHENVIVVPKTPEQLAKAKAEAEAYWKKHASRGGRRSSYSMPKPKLVNSEGRQRGKADGGAVTFSKQGLKDGGK